MGTTITRNRIARAALLGLLLCVCAPALADNRGRYLPDPLNFDDTTEVAYAGNPTLFPKEFTQDVFCPDFGKIGEVRFTYDTWTGDGDPPTPGWDVGGGALAGGFWQTNYDCHMEPGWEWGWVQTVVTKTPIGIWGAQPNDWYPDTRDKSDPDYPIERLPSLNPAPNPEPMKGFQDFPTRELNDGVQYWLAELGLVCKNTTTHEAHVLGTFTWGFIMNNDPAAIIPDAPHGWSSPSPSYLSTLNNSFNGQNGSVDWDFTEGCCCVPEPATWLLLTTGLVGLLAAGWRRRQRALTTSVWASHGG